MTLFKLDNKLIEEIQILIEAQKKEALLEKFKPFHFADVAEIIQNIPLNDAIYIIKILDSEQSGEILAEVEEDLREKIIETLSISEISQEIETLDTDDATDLILELPEEKQKKVLSKIKDKELVKNIKELSNYEEDTAGAFMAKELVKVNLNSSILNCLTEMRKYAKNVTRVHSIYVVNKQNKLKGRLSLKDILTAKSNAIIKDVYIPKVDYVRVDEEIEDVALLMQKYDLEAIPVVDENHILLGRITIDDVVSFIKEEATKDYQLAAGISKDVEVNDTVLALSRARFPWLLLGLLGGIGSVFILKGFEDIMMQKTLRNLFFYTPLIAAMAGNVGVQSSAIIVQGLANKVIKGPLISKLLKEIRVSILNGVLLSLVVILFGFIIKQDILLSTTIAFSMLSVIVLSGLIGTIIPLILDKRGIDPAIATGPFITTANDILGIFMFFLIAKSMLGF